MVSTEERDAFLSSFNDLAESKQHVLVCLYLTFHHCFDVDSVYEVS
jgi:hypothetical protein